MPGAVRPFERMIKRNNPKPTDLLFPSDFKKMMNGVLRDNGLKFDRDGKPSTSLQEFITRLSQTPLLHQALTH
ncbi:MAG: hypothetical protein COB36_09435 [Alphaproteobacteria bacterium]|nr:MAG: hypothetical protein COB36_09435 [Alphaproteobacteria bacterium]